MLDQDLKVQETGGGACFSKHSVLRILQDTHCQPAPHSGTQCEDMVGAQAFFKGFPRKGRILKNYKMTDLMIKNHALPLT